MPWDKVMDKFGKGKLRSGSKDGPPVKSKSQALAIMLSEKEKAEDGEEDYQPEKKSKPKHKSKKHSFKSLPTALGKKGKDNLGSIPLGNKMVGKK